MSKVVNTYWDTKSSRAAAKKNRGSRSGKESGKTPRWFAFAAIITITFMVCIAINLRAFSEMSAEITQNESLKSDIQELTNENMLLLKEVNGLKNDSKTIEREARKIGMSRPNEKILVPVN